jgi:hypothetical protein
VVPGLPRRRHQLGDPRSAGTESRLVIDAFHGSSDRMRC